MLFSTDNPSSISYVPPRLYQARTPFEKFKLSVLGFKNTGQRNEFGKALSWLPGGAGLGSDAIARRMFKSQDATTSLENLDITRQRDAQKQSVALKTLGAAGAAATGNPQLGFSLGSQAFGEGFALAKNRPQYDFSGDYFNIDSYGKGGDISPAKAKEMLSNPPHGKPLSEKQKHLFQAIAHGAKLNKYDDGGDTMKNRAGYRQAKQQVKQAMGEENRNMQMLNVNLLKEGYSEKDISDTMNRISPLIYNVPPGWKKYLKSQYGIGKPFDDITPEDQRWMQQFVSRDKGGNINGEDMIAIDQQTGEPQFTLKYGENIFSPEATKIIKNLSSKGKHLQLGKFVSNELKNQPKNSTAMAAGGDVVPQAYIDLVHKYFPQADWDTALKIIQKESSGKPDSTNVNTNKTTDYGLFQINSVHEDELKKAGIIKSLDDLKDPETNVKAAQFVKASNPKGWEQWATYDPVVMSAEFNNQGAADNGLPNWTKLLPPPLKSGEAKSIENRPDENTVKLGTFTVTKWRQLARNGDPAAQQVIDNYDRQYDLTKITPPKVTPPTTDIKTPGAAPTGTPAATVPERVPVEIAKIVFPKSKTGIPPIERTEAPPANNTLGDSSTGQPKPEEKQGFLDKIGGAEQIFNLAKFVTGIVGATTNLPHWQQPRDWANYVNRVRDMSFSGLAPQEQAAYKSGLDTSYAADTSNIRDISGGNSAFALGNQGSAINRYNRGVGQMGVLDSALRRQNIGTYGNVLGQDVAQKRQIFEDKYNQKLADKTAFSQLGQSGLQGLLDQYQYNRFRTKVLDPYYKSQKDYIDAQTEALKRPIELTF